MTLSAMRPIRGERIEPGAIAPIRILDIARSIMGVMITPGKTVLMRMPAPAYSTAAMRVS